MSTFQMMLITDLSETYIDLYLNLIYMWYTTEVFEALGLIYPSISLFVTSLLIKPLCYVLLRYVILNSERKVRSRTASADVASLQVDLDFFVTRSRGIEVLVGNANLTRPAAGALAVR